MFFYQKMILRDICVQILVVRLQYVGVGQHWFCSTAALQADRAPPTVIAPATTHMQVLSTSIDKTKPP